jgi:hypothetical protein
VPAIGDTLQYVLPGVREREPAARDEVDDRSRHKDLTRAGLRRDARADVNGDPRDVVAVDLDLAEWMPARMSMPSFRTASRIASAHAIARAGPSNVARKPSPVVEISRPR